MELKKYTKKNIEVYPVKYSGENEQFLALVDKGLVYSKVGDNDSLINIKTNKGEEPVKLGDYILLGMNGDFAVCREEDFNKLYEATDSETDISIDISENNKTNKKELIVKIQYICFLCLTVFLISFFSIISYSKLNKHNINEIVKICYQKQIEEESNKLVAQTKIEAEEIIRLAKEQAEIEAKETFRKEMERITNQKIGDK